MDKMEENLYNSLDGIMTERYKQKITNCAVGGLDFMRRRDFFQLN